jgi:acetyl-CoA C-acetyltransferase
MLAAQNIQLGLSEAEIAGGMESMTRTPYYVQRGSLNPAFGALTMEDGLVKDGLWDVYEQIHMGSCAEHSAKQFNISRQDQDEYAIRSFKRAQKAWAEHKFDEEIASVTIKRKRGDAATKISEDEGYKNLNEDKVPRLEPAFLKDGTGTITAANASTMNDGASAVVLVSAKLAAQYGATSRVLSQIVSYADAALDPIDFSLAPAKAIQLALDRASLRVQDIDLWEINEAFASVICITQKLLKLDGSSKINMFGGAIALGHALGSSGSRLLTTLVHQLKIGQYGVVALCNGGGAASAMIVRRITHSDL